MALSTGVSIAGQLAQGQAQKRANNEQARQDELRAAQELDASKAEAMRIRKAGDKTAGAARAQMAANGIAVGSGTAVTIEDDIYQNSELDAYNTLLTGKRGAGALQYSAAQSRARGSNAMTSSLFGRVTTGLQGWKGVRSG